MKQIITKIEKCSECPKLTNGCDAFEYFLGKENGIHPDCPLEDAGGSNEPLAYLSRAEIQLEFMRNLEREVLNSGNRNALRYWWVRTYNWVKVQKFINYSTLKAGSTSSTQQCIFMGVNPDGRSFHDMLPAEPKGA